MNGILLSQNKNFREEKKEFWQWCVFLVCLTVGTIFFYRSYHLDRQVSIYGETITVKVFDKIPGYYRRQRAKIGILHGSYTVYVDAAKRWYKGTAIGSETQVRYSSKYHAYLDPYYRPDKDVFFLIAMIFLDLIILWRTIWLGLYIWHWK